MIDATRLSKADSLTDPSWERSARCRPWDCPAELRERWASTHPVPAGQFGGSSSDVRGQPPTLLVGPECPLAFPKDAWQVRPRLKLFLNLSSRKPQVRTADPTFALSAKTPAESYTMEIAFTRLSSCKQALSMVSPPGETGRLCIAQKWSEITVLTKLPGTTQDFLDIEDKVSTSGESGLLGLAFILTVPRMDISRSSISSLTMSTRSRAV